LVTGTDPKSIPENAVLFDLDALEELLAQEPDPGRAFSRFPRRLDRQIRRANAYRLPMLACGALLLLRASGETWETLEKAKEEPARLLRVPSGRIFAVPPSHTSSSTDAAPPRPLEKVPPGLYRVRAFHSLLEEDWDLTPEAEKRLNAEDQAALRCLRGFGRLNLAASAAATVVVFGLRAFLLPRIGHLNLENAETVAASIILWFTLVWVAQAVIRKFHPAIRSARKRLADEVERMREALEVDWEDQDAAVLLERISDDPGDPGTDGWPQEPV